jgi:hypothetical protein
MKFCIPLDIYVDPGSAKIIELGTKLYPFKSLMLAFVEILNFHSHTDRNITVYVKESTTLYANQDSLYSINLDSVIIQTYSSGLTNARSSSIIFTDTGVNIFSKKTRFNLISNGDLELSNVLQNNSLTELEKTQVKFKNSGFVTNRWSFSITGFNIYTNFSSSSSNFMLVRPVHLQSKTLTLTDLRIEVSGYLLDTTDPLNLNASNLSIDYYLLKHGFYILSSWDYDGAHLNTTVAFDNITVTNSQSRTLALDNSFIFVAGPSDFVISNSHIDVYATTATPFPPIQFNTITSCNPEDEETQEIVIKNTTFVLNMDGNLDRYSQISMNVGTSYSRKVSISLEANTFLNFSSNLVPIVAIYGNSGLDIFISTLELDSYEFSEYALQFVRANKLTLHDISFRNITRFKRSLVNIADANGVDISTMVIDGCEYQDSVSHNYIEVSSSQSTGYLNISGLYFGNADTTHRYVVYSPSTPSLKIADSVFENATIHEMMSLVYTGRINELAFDDVKFIKISNAVKEDTTTKMFETMSLDVGPSNVLSLSNIKISNSSTPFMELSRITNYENSTGKLVIDGFDYSDSYIDTEIDLLSFIKLELETQFSIELKNLKFSNLQFELEGNLLSFKQQLQRPLTITNLGKFTSTYFRGDKY